MSDKLSIIRNEIELTRPTAEQLGMDKTAFSREMEWAIQVFQGNSYLQNMEQTSVRNCIVNLALTKLSLNPVMREAYLVPRKGKCCLDPSYIGLIKTITQTGAVKSIKANIVHSNEPFEIEQGTGGYVKHGVVRNGQPGHIIGAYSIAILPDGTPHVEWMYEHELQYIASRSEGVKAGKHTPWNSDPGEMRRKTVVKRHWKYLPKTGRALEAANAIAFDDEANGIDFEKERQEAEQKANAVKAESINIDLLDPNNPQDVQGFNKVMELFNSLAPHGTLNEGQFDVNANAKSFYDEFMSGRMTKEKANKFFEYLKGWVDYFKNQPQQTEEEL